MEQPTKEQIEQFWIKCGFEFKLSASENPHYWIDPHGQATNKLPKFRLDNIFRYAIPKLQSEGYQIDIVCHEHKGFGVSIFDVIGGSVELGGKSGQCVDDDLSLALFGAINQVIE